MLPSAAELLFRFFMFFIEIPAPRERGARTELKRAGSRPTTIADHGGVMSRSENAAPFLPRRASTRAHARSA